MKAYSKILVLVIVALFLTLTACSRSASQPPAALPSPTGVDFPFETQDPVSAASTQTAIAAQPVPAQPTNTPEVQVATPAPQGEGEQAGADATATVVAVGENPNVPAPTLGTIERPQTYTLKAGEWPICIARRYDLDLTSFFKLNGLTMDSKPAAGVTLKIPATGTWNNASYGNRTYKPHPVKHTVVAGQTIYSIACQYGDVAPEQILSSNGLQNAGDVKAGMTLNIP